MTAANNKPIISDPINIVYENKIFAVIDKPAGIACHQDDGLLSVLAKQQERFKGATLVSRLDRDTSGLLTIALSPKHHQEIEEKVESKIYLALLAGIPEPSSGFINESLPVIGKNNLPHLSKDAQNSSSEYKTIETFGSLALVQVKLHSGRKHQIRRHMANFGWHIVGDPIYGRRNVNKRAKTEFGLTRQFLHSHRLSVRENNDIVTELTAQLPDDLASMLKILKGNS